MHKEAYPTFLNFETELGDPEMRQNFGQFETKGAMEMIPRVIKGICYGGTNGSPAGSYAVGPNEMIN